MNEFFGVEWGDERSRCVGKDRDSHKTRNYNKIRLLFLYQTEVLFF